MRKPYLSSKRGGPSYYKLIIKKQCVSEYLSVFQNKVRRNGGESTTHFPKFPPYSVDFYSRNIVLYIM